MGALPFNPTYGASIGAPTRCPMTSWPPCARWAQGRTFRLIETQGTPGAVEGKLSQGGEFRVRIALGGPCTGRVEACEPPQRLLLTMRDPRSSTRPAGEDGDRSPADRRGRSDQAGTSSIWPTTSAVGSSATSRPAGVSSSQLTKHRTSAHPSSRRASQSTNRVGRRRLPADPRRDWGRR